MARTPDDDKRRALRLAGKAAEKARAAEETKLAAMRFAHDLGASLREISEVTDIPHVTVKRMLERTAADRDDS